MLAASFHEGRLLAVVLTLLVGLAAYKQPYWPATWIDEGFVTSGAETLVEDGRYALRSSDGWRTLDQPLIANGPGVVLPTALTMRLLGVGLWQARLTAAVFMVACGLLVYLTARRFGGPMGGLSALAIVLSMPREGFLYFGRMAMGNVPALAYFFAGMLLWMSTAPRSRVAGPLSAGILVGLAAITKAQWALMLLPAVGLAALADRTWVDRRRSVQLAAAVVGTVTVVALWHLVQVWLLGTNGYGNLSAGVQASARWTVLALDPARFTADSIHYLLRSGVAAVWLTATAYTVWLVLERSPMAAHATLLASISTVWLVWYAIVSVGWRRYAFEPTVVSAVLAGAALGHGAELWNRRARVPAWLGVLVGGVLVGYVAVHGVRRGTELATPPDRSAQEFAAYLNAFVDRDATMESWEWQLDVLIDQRVHHPTNRWVDDYTAQLFAGVPVTREYPWRRQAPRYLIDGPFSKFTGIYGRDLESGCCALEASRGPYDLYAVRPDRDVSRHGPRGNVRPLPGSPR